MKEKQGVMRGLRDRGATLQTSNSLFHTFPATSAVLGQQKPCCRHLASVGRRESPGKKPWAGGTGEEGLRRPALTQLVLSGKGLPWARWD